MKDNKNNKDKFMFDPHMFDVIDWLQCIKDGMKSALFSGMKFGLISNNVHLFSSTLTCTTSQA